MLKIIVNSIKLGLVIIWRRQWQPTPVLLPGKSHGQRSMIGHCPWGCKESDTTEPLHFPFLSFHSDHLHELDPDAGKDWRQKEEEVAVDEIDSITDSRDMNLSKLQEIVKDTAVHGIAKSQTWLSNWTTTTYKLIAYLEYMHKTKPKSQASIYATTWYLKI